VVTETGGIVAALVAFQAALPAIGKTSTAQYGKYADLADVSGIVLPRLAAVGLCYTAHLHRDADEGLYLQAELRHTSGEKQVSNWPISLGGPQQMGSQVTYARRYMLLALTGVHPAGEDDDAQDAQKAHEKLAKDTTRTAQRATRSKGKQPDDEWTDPAPAPRPKATDPRSAEQSTAIFTLLGQLGVAQPDQGRELIRRLAGREVLESSKDLTRAEASVVIDALRDIAGQDDPQSAVVGILG
jgi:hypothetical protein